MDVGVHERVEREDYAREPALNVSTLLWSRYSQEHMRAALDGLIEDTETRALVVGRAAHARLLEPHVYATEYMVSGPCQARLKTGKRAGDHCGCPGRNILNGTWLCEKHATAACDRPDNVVSAEDAKMIEALYAKILKHKVVALVRQHGGYEASVIGDMNGIRCKCRVDKLILGKPCPDTIVDLKTCELGGASPLAFSYAVKKYFYDVRAAFYVDLVKAATGRDCEFIWIAIEKEYPFAVNVVRANPQTIEIGREKYTAYMEDYREAEATGVWPGYCEDIVAGGLPDYEIQQWERKASGSGAWPYEL